MHNHRVGSNFLYGNLSLSLSLSLSLYIYIYIYTHTHMCAHTQKYESCICMQPIRFCVDPSHLDLIDLKHWPKTHH